MDRSNLTQKDKLIFAAIDTIYEDGIGNFSISKIAKREGINRSAVYRQFKNKEEVLESILGYYMQYSKNLMKSLREKNNRPKDALMTLILSYITWYESYPQLAGLIYTYDIFKYYPTVLERAKSAFKLHQVFFLNLIKEAQREGEINKNYSSQECFLFIQGYMKVIIDSWRAQKFSFSLKDSIKITIEKYLEP